MYKSDEDLTKKNKGYGYDEIRDKVAPHLEDFDAMSCLEEGYYDFLRSGAPDKCVRFIADTLSSSGTAVPVECYAAIESMASAVLCRYIGPYDIMYDGGGGIVVNPGSYLGGSAEVRYGTSLDCVAPDEFEHFVYSREECQKAFDLAMAQDLWDIHGVAGALADSVRFADCLEDLMTDTVFETEDVMLPAFADAWHALGLGVTPIADAFAGRFGAFLTQVVWLTTVWVRSPMPGAETYKRNNIPIFEECYEAGIKGCIVTAAHGIVSAEHFTLVKKEAIACAYCGVPVWCVEATVLFASTAYICEACLQAGLPKVAGVTCGTKFCAESRCRHHPFHHMGHAGMLHTLRNHGLLSDARRSQQGQLQGAERWKQLTT